MNNKYKDYMALSQNDYEGDIQTLVEVNPTHKKLNVLNLILRFTPPLVVVLYVVFYFYVGPKLKEDDSVDDYYSGYLYGTNFLFDFSTTEGALESVSVYDNPQYASIVEKLTASAEVWSNSVVQPEFASDSIQKKAWKASGGVVPWIKDTNVARTIEQKYSYSGAPNIVFFVVDDWGYNDIGYQSSYLTWTTPNIDKLAREGIKLTNFYTSEWCVPSRAAILTGRYALRFGMHSAIDDESQSLIELPLTEVTLAEELKSAGYRTSAIGKWHVGWSTYSHTPTYRGFDYFYGFFGAKIDYWTKKIGSYFNLMENTNLVTNSEEIDSSYHTAYLFEAKAEAVIKEHSEKYSSQPMFLYYGAQLVHSNWAVPESYSDRCTENIEYDDEQFDSAVYCGMNLLLDEVVSNLTCALDKYGMSDNTLIIFMSDNGGNLDADGANLPYRGCKGSLLRGAESVPAFVYGPESIIPAKLRGTNYNGLMHVTDLFPTIMGLATNGDWSGGYTGNAIDGIDMWSTITTNVTSPRREIVHFADIYGNYSYQYDNMKLIKTQLGWIGEYTDPRLQFIGEKSTETVCSFV